MNETDNQKLFVIQEGNTFIINEALEWKEIPEEVRNEAAQLVNDHNKTADYKAGRAFIIDVTGKHQVYYTLWLYKTDIDPRIAGYIKNPTYLGNVTTDLLSTVQKVLSKPAVQGLPVDLYTEDTKHGLIGKTRNTPTFTFGKYRGRSMAEVFLDDPGYFTFLAKNMDPKYENTANNLIIRHFASAAYKDITKKNQETSKSQYVGTINDRFQGTLEVYKIEHKPDQGYGAYTVNKLKDEQDNKFIVFNLEKNFPNVQVGDKVNLKGKIKAHKEIVGIKFTALNYVKPA